MAVKRIEAIQVEASAPKCEPSVRLRVNKLEADTLAAALKALGHPVRVQMLDLISQRGGEVCGCDIEAHFDLTQPTISHHLKVLREANLISSEQRGVWVHHHVNIETLAALRQLLDLFTPHDE